MAIKYSDLNNKVSKSDKTAVIAVLNMQPPTSSTERTIKTIQYLCKQHNGDSFVFTDDHHNNEDRPLLTDNKIYWAKRFFPSCKFVVLPKMIDNQSMLTAAGQMLYDKGYRNLIVVVKQEKAGTFQALLKAYNNTDLFKFKTCKVISTGKNPTSGADVRALATKPNIEDFKRWLPSTASIQDAKRLMNNIRTGMGITKLIESFSLGIDQSRDRYYKGEIFNVGDLVEDTKGLNYKISERRTNYVLVEDATGKEFKKWIWELRTCKT